MSTVHAFPSPDEAAVNMRDPTRRAMLPHIPPEWNPGASCKYEVKALYVEQMVALSRGAAVMETGAVDYDEKMSALEHIMGYGVLVPCCRERPPVRRVTAGAPGRDCTSRRCLLASSSARRRRSRPYVLNELDPEARRGDRERARRARARRA